MIRTTWLRNTSVTNATRTRNVTVAGRGSDRSLDDLHVNVITRGKRESNWVAVCRVGRSAHEPPTPSQANLLPSIVSATTKTPPFDLVRASMSAVNCGWRRGTIQPSLPCGPRPWM
jgi:hypothetical protein